MQLRVWHCFVTALPCSTPGWPCSTLNQIGTGWSASAAVQHVLSTAATQRLRLRLATPATAVLDPVLGKSTVKRGKAVIMKIGDAEVEVDPKFRLYLQVRNSAYDFYLEGPLACVRAAMQCMHCLPT